MLECLSTLDFWIQASVHVGIVLFVLGGIALVQLSSREKLPSSNGKALVLHTRDGSSILSGSTSGNKREMQY